MQDSGHARFWMDIILCHSVSLSKKISLAFTAWLKNGKNYRNHTKATFCTLKGEEGGGGSKNSDSDEKNLGMPRTELMWTASTALFFDQRANSRMDSGCNRKWSLWDKMYSVLNCQGSFSFSKTAHYTIASQIHRIKPFPWWVAWGHFFW